MYIPSELGYGDRGSPPKIGPGSVLVFQMEILSIDGDTVPALQCSINIEESSEESKCNDREIKYITKVKEWEADKTSQELKRIQAILSSPMKDDLRDWARRRVNVLEQFTAKSPAAGEEL